MWYVDIIYLPICNTDVTIAVRVLCEVHYAEIVIMFQLQVIERDTMGDALCDSTILAQYITDHDIIMIIMPTFHHVYFYIN